MAKSVKIIFFLLLCWPINALAGIFDPPVTDLSVSYLGTIFGGSVGSISLGTAGESNPFLGNLFQVFNGIILAVAAAILSYVGGMSILNTAHQGEVMGKKWSSIWIPLRSAGGLLLLAPVPGSGYSMLQVTVMWIILNGVGAADKIWNLVIDNLAQGISVSQVSKPHDFSTSGKTLGAGILKSLVCLQVVQNNLEEGYLQQINQTLGVNIIDDPNKTNSGNVFFGIQDLGNPSNTTNLQICGKIPITASVSAGDVSNANPTPTQEQLDTLSTQAYQTKKEVISSMISYIKPIATVIANTQPINNTVTLPNNLSPGLLYPAIGIHQNLLSNLTKQWALTQIGSGTNASVDSLVRDNVDKAKSQGWITAGAFYFLLNKGITGAILSTATTAMSISNFTLPTTNVGLRTTSPSSLKTDFQPYETAISNGSTIINKLFSNPSPNELKKKIRFTDNPWVATLTPIAIVSPAIGAVVIGLIIGLEAALESFIDAITNISDNEDPLLAHAKEGALIMGLTEGLLLGIAMGTVAGSIAMAMCEAASPGANMMISMLLTVIAPLMAIIALLWSVGATLGIYSPMIPYMIFAITSLGWLMLVVEAIVAAPIVALGLIMPEQEELGSLKTAFGIIAGIFLKPTLMIVGLLMSTKMFTVMLKLIGFGFAESISILQDETMHGSIFSCVPITVLYVGLVIALENKCFGLIYQLPDKILRWIGVSGENTDMSALGEAKNNFDKHASQGLALPQAAASAGVGHMKKTQEGNEQKAGEAAAEQKADAKADARDQKKAEAKAKAKAGGAPGGGGGAV